MSRLGDLERAVMEALWARDVPATGREVHGDLADRALAYTTVMTVLDRLARKGLVNRERDGRAWRYAAAAPRETYIAELMVQALELAGDRDSALVQFARSVSTDEARTLRDALDESREQP
ncbi:BlaI/MecI/CopY family transcriptional regulator [Amycolatopsis suaedae]|uniref:BlaI/MecI/CopY family transcriptional regulator n=1 Tax=Amycolatopsis suaedae TaxID=2510978 RepID=A0A4Q7J4V2_9PSEU|nr:BlaI/MecI/CopY family transcriptional regulator [Amycolatopsis suaedae]RZQ61702.1 BlaI/MecI/CopY family transcriptional regulator [Amycolatopsis suaedae]